MAGVMTTSTRRMATAVRRSRVRRVAESAYGLVLLARRLAMAAVVVLLVVAAVWASWGPTRQVLAADERGTMTVTACSLRQCTGTYQPASPGAQPRSHVVLKESVGAHKGERLPVALERDTGVVVRAGAAGVLRAALPLGGALLLGAVLIAGGLGLRRTARVCGLVGLVLVVATAFVAR